MCNNLAIDSVLSIVVKKVKNNIIHFSDRTPFVAVKTLMTLSGQEKVGNSRMLFPGNLTCSREIFHSSISISWWNVYEVNKKFALSTNWLSAQVTLLGFQKSSHLFQSEPPPSLHRLPKVKAFYSPSTNCDSGKCCQLSILVSTKFLKLSCKVT